MNTALSLLTELEARAIALDSAAVLVRVEYQRHAALVKACAYEWMARYQLKKLKSRLATMGTELTDDQLQELAMLLSKPLETVKPGLDEAEATTSEMRFWERYACARFRSLYDDIESLANSIAAEAARGHRPPLKLEYPKLSSTLYRDALMASALFRSVPRDSAESLPDPDYGF